MAESGQSENAGIPTHELWLSRALTTIQGKGFGVTLNTVQIITKQCVSILRECPAKIFVQKIFILMETLCSQKRLPDPEYTGNAAASLNAQTFTSIVAIRVECLLRLGEHGELNKFILAEERNLLWLGTTLINVQINSSSDSENLLRVSEILLAGAINFCVVGYYKKTCRWCEVLLCLLKKAFNSSTKDQLIFRRYQTVSYALLANAALLDNDPIQSWHWINVHLCSAKAEVEENILAENTNFFDIFLLFTLSHDIVELHGFLSCFLMEVFNIESALEDVFSKSELRDLVGSRLNVSDWFDLKSYALQKISILEKVRLLEPLAKLGCLYRDGYDYLHKKYFRKSKECLLLWKESWADVVQKQKILQESSLVETQALSTIGMNVLRTLGHISEAEEDFENAAVFYAQSLRLQKELFIDIHQSRTETEADLSRVWSALQKI